MVKGQESQVPSSIFNIEIGAEEYKKYGTVHDYVVKHIQEQPPESRDLALKALSWIVCAQRPLSTRELQEALAVREGMTNLDLNPFANIDSTISTITGLIQIREEKIFLRRCIDEQGCQVDLCKMRQTIRLNNDVAQYFVQTWKAWFPKAHHDMAIVCIVYLSFQAFEIEHPATEEYELYAYASQYWGYHANIHPVNLSLIFVLLESKYKLSACVEYLPLKRACGCCSLWRPKRISKLHLVVYFGLDGVVQTLVKNGMNVDVKDDEGRTPLSWAVEFGHLSIVKYLLDRGANLNMPEPFRNPLSWAVFSGNPRLFNMLVEHGAEPGGTTPTYEHLLLLAAGVAQEEFVRMILDRNVDLSFRASDYGRSAISWAAGAGRENVVKLLLSRGADVNSKDINGEIMTAKNEGKTPLTWATLNGHWSIVDLLLQHGAESVPAPVNPKALSDAAINGEYEVVRRFLEIAVSADFREKAYGCSPLSLAAKFGHDDVVELLLDWGVDPNSKDINEEPSDQNNKGKTPLMWACMNGHSTIAKTLLDRGADPNLQEKDGRTPLSWASEHGHVAVVQILLRLNGNPNQPDTYRGQSPVAWAAMNGHRDTVRLLLENGGDAWKKDNDGRTALNSADMHHKATAGLLLELGAAREPSAKMLEMSTFQHEPFKYTPLPTPTSIRLLSLIEDFTEQDTSKMGAPLMQYSLDVVDLNDDPLFEALSYTWGSPFPENSEEAREYQDPNNTWPIAVNDRILFIRKNLRDFLHHASSKEKVVDEQHKPHNKTSLIQAAEEGRANAVRLYLSAGANTEVQDVFGKTALHYAAQHGHLEVLKLLVEAGADPQKLDNTKMSPLTYARDYQRASNVEVVLCLENSGPHGSAIRRVSQRRFWIDAICINQDYVPERNAQVAIISQIYRKAASVLVWLGVADKYTQYAAGSLGIFSPPTREWAALTARVPGSYPPSLESTSLQCLGIINLMKRTWFQRVWVIQEAALAPHIQIFCGEHQFDYVEIFCLLQCCLFIASVGSVNQRFNPDIRSDMGGSEAYTVTDIRLRTTQTGMERNWLEQRMGTQNKQLGPTWQRALSLPLLMSRVWALKATDPRDKIFALLGITREPSIVADYTKPVSEIFIAAARLFLRGSPGETLQLWQTGKFSTLEYLEGLSYVQRFPKDHVLLRDNLYQLPSWVPDFNVPLFTHRLWSPKFRTGTSIDPPLDVPSLGPNVLSLSGVLVDEVIALDAERPEPWTLRFLPQKWLEVIMPIPPTYVTGENRTQALCRTLMVNADLQSVKDPDREVRLRFRHWIQRSLCFAMWQPKVVEHLKELRETDPSDLLPSEEEMAGYLKDLKTQGEEYTHDGMHKVTISDSGSGIGAYYAGRRLFRTRKGLLGLGPYAVQQGDQVWVVPGGRTPYVFRPLSHSDPSQREFIGESYVHGIMNGEALQEKDIPDLQPVSLV